VPQEVAWSSDFYVTICANPRRQNHFCRDPVGSAVLSSARRYQNLSKWGIHVLLLMPDHLHLVVTPYLGYDITGLITTLETLSHAQLSVEVPAQLFRTSDSEQRKL